MKISSKHCYSQTLGARELTFWENIHPLHALHVTYHISHGLCPISNTTDPPSPEVLKKSDKGDPYSGRDGNQVLLKLSGGPCAANRTSYNIWRKLEWWPGLVESAGGCCAGSRDNQNTWRKLCRWPGLVEDVRGRFAYNTCRKLRWWPGLVEAVRGCCSGNRAGYNTWRKWGDD